MKRKQPRPIPIKTAPYNFLWANGTISLERPRDGSSYTIIVRDHKRYEEACRSGEFYIGLGGEIIDNRKTIA